MEKVTALKTSVLSVLCSFKRIVWRNDNLVHKQRHLIVGQFRASRGTWFAVNLGSLRIILPTWDLTGKWGGRGTRLELPRPMRQQNTRPSFSHMRGGAGHETRKAVPDGRFWYHLLQTVYYEGWSVSKQGVWSGGGSFQNRGYNSSWEDIQFKIGDIHLKREYNLSGEGVHFMSRGGTLHVERGYYSCREGALFTSRGGALRRFLSCLNTLYSGKIKLSIRNFTIKPCFYNTNIIRNGLTNCSKFN